MRKDKAYPSPLDRYCTGGGGNLTPQSQSLGQHAGTSQGATSLGTAHQGASNTASPVTVG